MYCTAVLHDDVNSDGTVYSIQVAIDEALSFLDGRRCLDTSTLLLFGPIYRDY